MSSVLRALAGGGHFYEAGMEAGKGLDEIVLGGHDLVDVFIDHGDFVETGGEEGDAGVC